MSEGPSPPIGFCLGWSKSFVGSESGQIASPNSLQNMVSNRTQQYPPALPSHKL
jgi:hypothetical protein